MENIFIKALDRRGRVLWASNGDASHWDRLILDYVSEGRDAAEASFTRCVIRGEAVEFIARWDCPMWDSHGLCQTVLYPIGHTPRLITLTAVVMVQSVLRDNHLDFTRNDRELLQFLGDDYTIREIASRLDKSESTIDARLRNLKTKLGARTLHGVMAAAARGHLIPLKQPVGETVSPKRD